MKHSNAQVCVCLLSCSSLSLILGTQYSCTSKSALRDALLGVVSCFIHFNFFRLRRPGSTQRVYQLFSHEPKRIFNFAPGPPVGGKMRGVQPPENQQHQRQISTPKLSWKQNWAKCKESGVVSYCHSSFPAENSTRVLG